MPKYAYDDRPSCPFCPFTVASSSEREIYHLMEHLEIVHPEDGESPFIVQETITGELQEAFDQTTWPKTDVGDSNQICVEGTTLRGNQQLSTEAHSGDYFIECPLGCGEAIHNKELAHHMELHETESLAMGDRSPGSGKSPGSSPPSIPGPSSGHKRTSRDRHLKRTSKTVTSPVGHSTALESHSSSRHSTYKALSTLGSFKGLFLGPAPQKTRSSQPKPKSGPRRLGKSELGPYAYEERMPAWLHSQLERGAKVSTSSHIGSDGKIVYVERVANETIGILPVLGQLCQQDSSVSKVYLCHPTVKHVFKMSREGGFCGYRNIQMLISFIQGTKSMGGEHFPGRTPSILLLQELIEEAWDRDFNSTGRIETGGIRGTRKYIGTPEAQALFGFLNINCEASAFNANMGKAKVKMPVHHNILQAVLEYFQSHATKDDNQKVHQTELAPLYFQHPGHSLTIVGIEIRKSGIMNLLVFDPMFKTTPGIVRLIGSKFKSSAPERLLKSFRRGDAYLGKYNSFEILQLTDWLPRAVVPAQ